MKSFLSRSTGLVYLVLYTLCTSTVPVAVKIGIQKNISPIEILGIRFILAVVLLWAYFLCFRRDLIRIDRAGLIGSILAAMTNCISISGYYFTLSYLDASLTLVIYTTALIPAAMLLLMIRGEYPSRLDLIRFVIALIGIYLFVNVVVGEVSGIGLLLAIFTPFFYALYMTIIQLRLSKYGTQTITLYVITFMTIFLSVAYLAAGYRLQQFDAVAWGVIFWLVIVVTIIARLLFFAGVKIAGSRQAALLLPLEILLTVFWAVLLLGESLSPQQWVGTFFVIVSVGLGAKAKSDPEHPDATKAPDVQPKAIKHERSQPSAT